MHIDGGGRGPKGDREYSAVNYAGDYKLWAEVLKLAVLDLQERDLHLKRAAQIFIKSEEPRFPSFISICRALDLAPGKIREQLLLGQTTKESFQIKTMMCCECGRRMPIKQMKKLRDFGMYVCPKCARALARERN